MPELSHRLPVAIWQLIVWSSVVVLLLAAGPVSPVGAETTSPARCFPETGYCVQGRFLEYWDTHGGLARNGYPISAERRELLEDGREYTVQYFERVRMEHHPDNQSPYDVLLGQFGRRALRAGDDFIGAFPTAPVEPLPGASYFPETGHNLSGRFLDYWHGNGGLAQFGYPITEETVGRRIDDGREYTVQYFERARFEYHPEHAGTAYAVLLGQFGRPMLADADLLAGAPSFNRLYLATERVQEVLGHPSAAALQAPGGYQAFERGAMLWRGDTRQIYVLCGDRQAGDDVLLHADTWQAGDDPGGGAAPAADLFLPGRGFGKVWREDQRVRDCLGYALTPAETAYTMTVQPFQRYTFHANLMLSAATPEGDVVYTIYQTFLGSSACISRPALCRPDYQRYPAT